VKIPPVDEGKFVSKLGEKSRSADSAPSAAAKPVPTPKSPDAATAAAAKQSSTAPPESKKPSTDAAPVASQPPAKEATPPAPTQDTSSSDAANPSRAVAAPSVKPASEANPPAATEAAKGAKPPSAAFSVQLAAFSDDKGANALANRLKKAGHPAYTEPYASSQGTLWRVRVGPYATRDAAEAARTKLKADGQNGIIAAAN